MNLRRLTYRLLKQLRYSKNISSNKIIFVGFCILIFLILLSVDEPDSKNYPNLSPTPKAILASDSAVINFKRAEYDELSRVVFVFDGDTVKLKDGRVLRYIGVDSPEKDSNCYHLAKQANMKLVLGKQVGLVKDVSDIDRYGRILRYVYVDDIFVNEYMVRNGFATVSTYAPDVAYSEMFLESQIKARSENRGIWNAQICSDDVQGISEGDNPKNQTLNCQFPCTGVDRDCKDFSTQQAAQDFFDCCGFSSEYDPMRLDSLRGVGDGVVCENLP